MLSSPVVNRPILEVSIEKIVELTPISTQDHVAIEEPLEIQLVFGPIGSRRTKSISVTMRTPGHDSELAAGFLLTEGIIRDAAEIERIVNRMDEMASDEQEQAAASHGDESFFSGSTGRNIVCVELAPDIEVKTATLERNFYTTSSCGLCGKASLLALRSVCPPRLKNNFSIRGEILHGLPERLRSAQSVFDSTGGLHGAGLFDSGGNLLMLREDVGRHNAVDKLFGAQFLADQTPLRDKLLLLSGRASFELLQKAIMAGIPMIAAVGAPSSLAVQVARDFNVTLVGFLREHRFNIYHGTDHIQF